MRKARNKIKRTTQNCDIIKTRLDCAVFCHLILLCHIGNRWFKGEPVELLTIKRKKFSLSNKATYVI